MYKIGVGAGEVSPSGEGEIKRREGHLLSPLGEDIEEGKLGGIRLGVSL